MTDKNEFEYRGEEGDDVNIKTMSFDLETFVSMLLSKSDQELNGYLEWRKERYAKLVELKAPQVILDHEKKKVIITEAVRMVLILQ